MKKYRNLLILIFVLLVAGESVAEAQTSIFDRWKARRIEKKMSGSKRKVAKEKKISEPRSVTKAKKEQAKREDKLRDDYQKATREERNRHFNIQTADVQERMKQNEKEIEAREKEKRKAMRKAGRKARKKYKK
ncbi:MAG: hypothetical protein ACQETA_06470 [Bacteroidota bacterium]